MSNWPEAPFLTSSRQGAEAFASVRSALKLWLSKGGSIIWLRPPRARESLVVLWVSPLFPKPSLRSGPSGTDPQEQRLCRLVLPLGLAQEQSRRAGPTRTDSLTARNKDKLGLRPCGPLWRPASPGFPSLWQSRVGGCQWFARRHPRAQSLDRPLMRRLRTTWNRLNMPAKRMRAPEIGSLKLGSLSTLEVPYRSWSTPMTPTMPSSR